MGVIEAYQKYKYRSLWVKIGHIFVAAIGCVALGGIGYAVTLRPRPGFSMATLIAMDESRFREVGMPSRFGHDSVRYEVAFVPSTGHVSQVDVLGDSLLLRRIFDQMRYHSAYMPFAWKGENTLLLSDGTLSLWKDTLSYRVFENVEYKIK